MNASKHPFVCQALSILTDPPPTSPRKRGEEWLSTDPTPLPCREDTQARPRHQSHAPRHQSLAPTPFLAVRTPGHGLDTHARHPRHETPPRLPFLAVRTPRHGLDTHAMHHDARPRPDSPSLPSGHPGPASTPTPCTTTQGPAPTPLPCREDTEARPRHQRLAPRRQALLAGYADAEVPSALSHFFTSSGKRARRSSGMDQLLMVELLAIMYVT